MKKHIKKFANFLSKNFNALSIIINFFAFLMIWLQLYQANEHKRWDNFNQLNKHYSDWYRAFPKEVTEHKVLPNFETADSETKKWVRDYFDLYAEEYYLYLHHLIPDEMWTERIEQGMIVNLNEYPLLAQGYSYWKSKGAFTHPKGVIELIDKKIAELHLKNLDTTKSESKSES